MPNNIKSYQYNGIPIYIFILTLKNASPWRQQLVRGNIARNPNINLLYAIDGNDIPKMTNYITSNKISFVDHKRWKSARGKTLGTMGRWLSTIQVAKLSFDTNSHIIVLEDDLELPNNFDFQFDRYLNNNRKIVRFGVWGDGYHFSPRASKFFLNSIYNNPIYQADDVYIQCLPNRHLDILSRKVHGYQKKNNIKKIDKSTILDRSQIFRLNYFRKETDPKPLLTTKKYRRLINDLNRESSITRFF